ncbi:MAG: hypothetical protein ACTS3F_11720 [Phycisphaerales bacterium]
MIESDPKHTPTPGEAGVSEIRRHERVSMSLGARLAPMGAEPGARADLRLTSAAPTVAGGGLEVVAVDLSDGGIGFISPVMLPRNAVFQARVLAPPGAITTSLIETRVVVRRCQMIDRSPRFLIGTAYADRSQMVREKVRRAMGMLSIAEAEASGPGRSRHGEHRGKGAA